MSDGEHSQALTGPIQAHGRRFVPSNFPVPQPMVCKGDLATNWEFFRQQYEDYEVATELSKQATLVRLASLRSLMGKDCLQIFRNLSLFPAQQESVTSYLDALESYFKPQRNVVYERYVFNTCVQTQDESVDAYVNRLRKLASSCDFGVLTDEVIRDRLVIGVRDKDLKGRLLRQKGLSLTKAIEMSRQSSEITKQQLKSLETEERKSIVEEINHFKQRGKARKPKPARPATSKSKGNTRDSKDESERSAPRKNCKYCGNQLHRKRRECPAFGQVCHKCNKSNHFASVCNAKRPNQVNRVADEEDSDSDFSR